jgi:hypothetical protein
MGCRGRCAVKRIYVDVDTFVRKYNVFMAAHEEYLVVGGQYGGYVFTHGEYDGEIPEVARRVAEAKNLCVVCCFPAAVKQRYPQLDVLGDWNKTTKLRKAHGQIHAVPGLSMSELASTA